MLSAVFGGFLGAVIGTTLAALYHERSGTRREDAPFTAMVTGLADVWSNSARDAAARFVALTTPVPERGLQELRDLAREHNLDVVERGEARIDRREGELVATWGGEELTRYKEVAPA